MFALHSSLLKLIVASLVALFSGGCIRLDSSPSARFKETRTMSVAHKAGSAIRVATGNGALSIKKGDVADVKIEAEISCISEERLAATRVVAERAADGKLNVEVAWPGGKAMNNEGCRFDITLPDAKDVEALTTNGAITVTGLAGQAIARTTNGTVVLTDHDGAAEVSSTNGRIEFQSVAGASRASTTNGHINIAGANGPVRASSTNGSITVQLTDASAGPVTSTSTNGSIELTIGKAFVGTVNASNTNGSIDVPQLIGAQLVRVQKHSASLVIGQSPNVSELRTTNGSIRIRPAVR